MNQSQALPHHSNSGARQRWVLANKVLSILVQQVDRMFHVILLILIDHSNGNVLRWAALPFEPERPIDLMQEYRDLLLGPALRSASVPPDVICVDADLQSAQLLTSFLAALADTGQAPIQLARSDHPDRAKANALLDLIDEQASALTSHTGEGADLSHLPTLDTLQHAISSSIDSGNTRPKWWIAGPEWDLRI